jgi:hypothetical protein
LTWLFVKMWFKVHRNVNDIRKQIIIVCLFCRSYELICAWKGWLYVSLWKLLFVFLYHWHFGGLWTTFLQIIMSKFNVMNFHHTTNPGIRSNGLWSHHLNPYTDIRKCTKKSYPLRHKWLHQQNTRMRDKHAWKG